jgi:hypothetical protein
MIEYGRDIINLIMIKATIDFFSFAVSLTPLGCFVSKEFQRVLSRSK